MKDFPPCAVIITGGLLDFPAKGASANLAAELWHGFAGNGLAPMMVPLDESRVADGPVRGVYQGADYAYLHAHRNPLHRHFRGSSTLSKFFSAFKLSRLIKSRSDSLTMVFALSLSEREFKMIARACRRSQVPFVYFLVEEPSSMFRMGWQSGLITLNQLKRAEARAETFYKKTLTRATVVCCITKALADYAIDRGVPAEKVFVLPNVKRCTNSVSNNESASPGKPLTLIYSGRINFVRDDFDILFEAWERAMQESLPLRLEIYGSGPQKDEMKINDTITERGLTESVEFRGFIERGELEARQASADAFLLLKADIEQNRFNYPTKLMDYLNWAGPVIMSDISSHRVHFIDKKNCIMVQPGSAQSLLRALRWLVENEHRSREIGLRGRALLQSNFDPIQNAGSLIDMVRSQRGGNNQ